MGRPNHSQDPDGPPAGFPRSESPTGGLGRALAPPADLEAAEQALDRIIGRRIREGRLARGMTQGQLARALGCSYQQIQKYENGTNRIAAARLILLAERLGLSPSSLLGTAAAGEEPRPDQSDPHGGTMRAARELARGFGDIRNAEVRSALASLVRAVVDRQV